MKRVPNFAPRLLAGFGTLALIGAIGLVSSRPAHTTGGPIAVNVANTPLATTATDSPAKQPFQQTVRMQTNNTLTPLATVPAGKRLVIESVMAYSDSNDHTQNGNVFVFSNQSGSNEVSMELLATNAPYPAATEKVLLYAEAGETPGVLVENRNYSVPAIQVTVSGYYVDVP